MAFGADAGPTFRPLRPACARFAHLATRLLASIAVLASALAGAQGIDAPRGDTRLVVFGDFNGPYGSTAYPAPVAGVVDAILQTWRPDLVVFTGDVVAGQSRSLTAEDLASMWGAFDRDVAAKLRAARVPYALTVGNHDASSLQSGGEYAFPADRAAAREYWSRPEHRAGLELLDSQDLPFHYSFTVGDVFVAVIDASSAAVTSERRSWLRDQLDSEAAQTAIARFVVGHLPLVPVSVGRDSPGESVSDAVPLAEVLSAGCATAYVSGHHAAYYPGDWDGLELLAAGGVGARRLLGIDGAPRSTVTVVDVWHEPSRISYTTYDAVTLEPVPADDLPARLPSGLTLSRRASGPVPIECGG